MQQVKQVLKRMGCWVSKLPQENSMAPTRSHEFCEPEPLTEVSVTPTLLEESSEHLQEVSISPTPSVEFSSEFLNFVVDDRKDQVFDKFVFAL